MTPPTHEDEKFMRIAIQAAREAMAQGNPPFGAILVKGDEVLMVAGNEANTKNDCTLHAELNLVSQASRRFDAQTLAECTLYASTEPCPMCAGAIYWLGVQRVVFGCATASVTSRPYKLFPYSREILNERTGVEVVGPLLEDEALAVHHEYRRGL